jgi:hypothetical protein
MTIVIRMGVVVVIAVALSSLLSLLHRCCHSRGIVIVVTVADIVVVVVRSVIIAMVPVRSVVVVAAVL